MITDPEIAQKGSDPIGFTYIKYGHSRYTSGSVAQGCWTCGLAYVLSWNECWSPGCSSPLVVANLMVDPQLRDDRAPTSF